MKHLYISFLILFILSCSSGFYKKERIYLSDNIALYLIDENDYPEEEIKQYLNPVQKFPDNAIENISLVLANLEVEKEGIFSKDILSSCLSFTIRTNSKYFKRNYS
ncbi:MAG: hypothetical protein KatS3mg129_1607 [Leptospiraceae bacterium]|nr:MAG: hypothetical protein KatS3mg129_1607 [Leptospiraceae bacterium]